MSKLLKKRGKKLGESAQKYGKELTRAGTERAVKTAFREMRKGTKRPTIPAKQAIRGIKSTKLARRQKKDESARQQEKAKLAKTLFGTVPPEEVSPYEYELGIGKIRSRKRAADKIFGSYNRQYRAMTSNIKKSTTSATRLDAVNDKLERQLFNMSLQYNKLGGAIREADRQMVEVSNEGEELNIEHDLLLRRANELADKKKGLEDMVNRFRELILRASRDLDEVNKAYEKVLRANENLRQKFGKKGIVTGRKKKKQSQKISLIDVD